GIIEAFGQRPCTHDAADVGRNHDQVVVLLPPDVTQQNRRGVDVVDRHIEKALNLIRVQVDRQHPVGTGAAEHAGDHLGRNRHASRTGAPVLTRVTEIRDDRGNATGGCTMQRVNQHHQFHDIVIGRLASRLHYEYIATTHVFVDLNGDFTV